ncbi:hypothetical protein [Sphingomonas sp.]|uniref:hypothetical protein n=1 Tax=Sphingomonas sp. TaxID=28214 RepID=UPI00183D2CE3|nr:hypothetical protein [Sphingomonas sp.]MBA3511288.1 hypothetical protein [Sphingomonas sp.]
MMRNVGEASTDCHAGGMTPRAKQEAVAAEPRSFTGQYLKPLLERSTRAEPSSPAKAGAQPNKDSTESVRPEQSLSRAKSRGRGARKTSSSEDQPDLIPAK